MRLLPLFSPFELNIGNKIIKIEVDPFVLGKYSLYERLFIWLQTSYPGLNIYIYIYIKAFHYIDHAKKWVGQLYFIWFPI